MITIFINFFENIPFNLIIWDISTVLYIDGEITEDSLKLPEYSDFEKYYYASFKQG